MRFREIYELGIAMGIEADPRGRELPLADMAAAKALYEDLNEVRKAAFDMASLDNPYADSRILCGDEQAEVRCMMVGIDMDLPEMLLARELEKQGEKIDLIMSHHPRGVALTGLDRVMPLLAHTYAAAGIRLNETQQLLEPKRREVRFSTGSGNYQRTVDAARLLGMNMMCMHTPCDNMVTSYLNDKFTATRPCKVGDIIDLLLEEEEYRIAATRGNEPVIACGGAGLDAGRIFVDMTGGAEGPEEYCNLLAQAGISTLVVMAAGNKMLDMAGEAHLNLVIAGHMASDSLGVNLFLDKVEAAGVKILPAAGLIRNKREQE